MGKTYPVGIVGEANYQSAARRCSAGQVVRIVREPDNPYDSDALAVITDEGQTIGYIARDCWLQDAIHEESRGCEASIKEINDAGNGLVGIVLDVRLIGKAVGTRAFKSTPCATEAVPKGWLSRIIGL